MLVAIFFTHKRANDSVREKSINSGKKDWKRKIDGIKEKVFLATCYRVEIYLRVEKEKKKRNN